MGLEDRIRPAIDTAVSGLTAQLETQVRGMVAQVVGEAAREQEAAVEAARRLALETAEAEARQRVLEAETRAQAREREAEMAAFARLLESLRLLDSASTLTDVLDALADAARREVARAALLVVRNERLIGWKLSGFGRHDTQPKGVELGLTESGLISAAVAAARPMTLADAQSAGQAPAFAQLPAGRTGYAVPVIVGGRVVAVIYADSGEPEREHETPSGWPEVLEILARHAARCLEALTVQKAAGAVAPRFWVQSVGRPPSAATPAASTSRASDRASFDDESGASPGITA